MLRRELSTFVELWRNPTPDFHNGLEHLIIAIPCEEDLPSVQFKQCATNRPHVYTVVVGNSKDHFWGPVEAAD